MVVAGREGGRRCPTPTCHAISQAWSRLPIKRGRIILHELRAKVLRQESLSTSRMTADTCIGNMTAVLDYKLYIIVLDLGGMAEVVLISHAHQSFVLGFYTVVLAIESLKSHEPPPPRFGVYHRAEGYVSRFSNGGS